MTVSNKHTSIDLFFQMLRIRRVEEAIATEYAAQEMRCPTHLCIGQEAIAVGVSAHLQKTDIVMSTHRSHGHFLAKGGSLPGMIAELYGKETGVAGGWGGSQHLIDLSVNFLGATPIVGSTIPVAVGTAFAQKMNQELRIKNKGSDKRIIKQEKKSLNSSFFTLNSVSVVFFGDAAMEEGVVHEVMSFAVLKKLPMIFVCENNGYSTYTPITLRQPRRPLSGLAKAHGLAVGQGDGNDVESVYTLAKHQIARVRAGNGPAFLEFQTYRLREHVGPNMDPEGYRPMKEISSWQKKDPIERLRGELKKKQMVDDRTIEQMEGKIRQEIEAAFAFAKESRFPKEKVTEEMAYAGEVKSLKS